MEEKQAWEKKGLIFSPQGDVEWMASHAALPVADRLAGDIYRIYFSTRDKEGRSQIGYIDIDINNPGTVLNLSPQPVICIGHLGSFEDSGVTSSWIATVNEKKFQYYTGWSTGVTVPFYLYVGLAMSEDGGTSFHKFSESPILERDRVDPYLTASPCVLIEDGRWKMWYVSGVKWELVDRQPRHYYHIKYAESADGIHWQRDGVVCIDFRRSDEYAISRSCVLREKGMYRMWYSWRGQSYRIGYAESRDGLRWERKDEHVGIDVSGSGWDSEMIEYPFVFDHNGKRYMLYNGNDYGKTGIGLAVLAS